MTDRPFTRIVYPVRHADIAGRLSEAQADAEAFSSKPSDRNWCWLYLLASGRRLAVRRALQGDGK